MRTSTDLWTEILETEDPHNAIVGRRQEDLSDVSVCNHAAKRDVTRSVCLSVRPSVAHQCPLSTPTWWMEPEVGNEEVKMRGEDVRAFVCRLVVKQSPQLILQWRVSCGEWIHFIALDAASVSYTPVFVADILLERQKLNVKSKFKRKNPSRCGSV